MKRNFVLAALFALLPAAAGAQVSVRTAEERLERITAWDARGANGEDPGARAELETLYEALEGDTYAADSREDPHFALTLSDYDLARGRWEAAAKVSLPGAEPYSRVFDILWSDAMGRRYTPPDALSANQRNSYEYYINEYEKRIRSGEPYFFAVLTFKITRGTQGAECTLEGERLTVYRDPEHPREMCSFDESELREERPSRDGREGRAEEERVQDAASGTPSGRSGRGEDSPRAEGAGGEGQSRARWEQIPRRAFYVSADARVPAASSTPGERFPVGLVSGTLTFGIGRFFFAGAVLGIDLSESLAYTAYSFGVTAGACATLGRHARPYASISINVLTSDQILVNAGAGCDLIISRFMFTAGATYNLKSYINSANGGYEHYPAVYAGAGITW